MRIVNDKMRFPFKELTIGSVFEFASIEDFPYSGLERGPWTKISARKYEKTGPRAMVCTIGSVNVEVIPDNQLENE